MKAIILARVSTEEQREAGNSLPAQVKRLEDYCARKAFKIIKKYSFDESAYKNKRDEFDKILSLNLPNSKVVPLFLDFSPLHQSWWRGHFNLPQSARRCSNL